MSILVTGGAGYIGSHTCVALMEAGRDVILADNFVNAGFGVVQRIEKITGKPVTAVIHDFCDEAETERLFERFPQIDGVIHFAALKAVEESHKKPLEYYANNLGCTLSVLRAMQNFGVRRFVYSSSATVYGDSDAVPFQEGQTMGRTTNPYGETKAMCERIIGDFLAARPTFQAAILRYFNPIGAHESGLIGEDPRGIPNNLIPYVAKVAAGILPQLTVFGSDYNTPDGTCIRDYIHVMDLAEGHLAALRRLETDETSFICNLGTGRGYSVLEVLDAYSRACGREIPYQSGPRREGDIAVCYADPKRATDLLGWTATRTLADMCRDSWNWQSKNPGGYENEGAPGAC